jgi:hypothetical protein
MVVGGEAARRAGPPHLDAPAGASAAIPEIWSLNVSANLQHPTFHQDILLLSLAWLNTLRMETPHANRLKGLIPKGSNRRSSLSTAQRFALYFITEFEYTEKLSIKGRDVDYGTLSKVEVVKAPATDNLVNLARPPEPTVSYFQIANFVVWSVMVIVIQMWRDYREGRPFRSVLANDFATHYFVSHSRPCEFEHVLMYCSTYQSATVHRESSHQVVTTGS